MFVLLGESLGFKFERLRRYFMTLFVHSQDFQWTFKTVATAALVLCLPSEGQGPDKCRRYQVYVQDFCNCVT